MFIGHFGLAMAAKQVAPRPSLGTLVPASQPATRARDRLGIVLFWLFVATLAVLYAVVVFGPPPPSVRVLAMSGLLGWLFVAWAYWIDRHREPAMRKALA